MNVYLNFLRPEVNGRGEFVVGDDKRDTYHTFRAAQNAIDQVQLQDARNFSIEALDKYGRPVVINGINRTTRDMRLEDGGPYPNDAKYYVRGEFVEETISRHKDLEGELSELVAMLTEMQIGTNLGYGRVELTNYVDLTDKIVQQAEQAASNRDHLAAESIDVG